MDGRKVANFLQQGYRMQKPKHVDNELLVKKSLCVISWLKQFSDFNDLILVPKFHSVGLPYSLALVGEYEIRSVTGR